MSRHRHRSPRRGPVRLAASAAATGAALVAMAAPAQALTTADTPQLNLPDVAGLLTAHNDIEPAPAPVAPPIESSLTHFPTGDLLNQGRDIAPLGLPATALVQAAAGATKIIPN